MKISWFKRNITPEIGTRVSGYGMEDVTFSKWSDLLMTGLLADDGERKVLLISFDLQCMDIEYIYKFRKLCGDIFAIPPEAVMLTFTHTHGGPQTNCEAGFAVGERHDVTQAVSKLYACDASISVISGIYHTCSESENLLYCE